MKITKKSIYIGLFSVLYLIVAFSSFWHACAFFGLANNSWMSIILAFAFEIGQAAVLFSLLTSKKDRSRIMPWVLMTMFTLVQVIGNVFSSYKYIILNSIENLRFFKEPIFIWTTIPDDQATVIIVYLVGALLPIASLLLTSMITNYLSDQEEIKELEKNETNTQSHEAQNGKQQPQRDGEETNQKKEENFETEDKPKELIEDSLTKVVDKPIENEIKPLNNTNEIDIEKEIESPKHIDEEKSIESNNDIKSQNESNKGDELNKALDNESKIFDLPKSELLKPNFTDAKVPVNKEIEDLIKNGIKEEKKENEKISHFINQ